MKKTLLLIGALLLTGFLTVGIFAASTPTTMTSTSLDLEDSYTLEEMLNITLLDELKAKATYEAIIDTYGEVKPFTRIVLAEQRHIDALLVLFNTYGFEVPTFDASTVVVPESLTAALEAGVQAEVDNIALYDAFLSQIDLPEDVVTTFTALQRASENHLRAFNRGLVGSQIQNFGQQIRNQFGKLGFKGNGHKGNK